MLSIRLVNNVPMTLNITPTTSKTGGMSSAQGEETKSASGESANPRKVSTPRKAVP